MKYLLGLGVMLAMMGCSTNPPQEPAASSAGSQRNEILPSPTQIPAEIDPPPVPPAGSEEPARSPTQPPAEVDPPRDLPNGS